MAATLGPTPVLDAMRKLDTKGEPSLVRQLYALALLNRDDAMRKFHSGLPPDVILAQQPPSLLALARPPESGKSSGFQPARTAPLRKPPRTAVPMRTRVRTGPRFGAMSSCIEQRGDDATHAISAARERAIPAFQIGYGVPDRIARAQTANAQFASLTGTDPRAERARSLYDGNSSFASTLGAAGSSLATLSKAPLRPSDLEATLPVRLSQAGPHSLSSPSDLSRAAGQNRFSKQQLTPLPRSTVRELLEVPTVRAATPNGPNGPPSLKPTAHELSRRRPLGQSGDLMPGSDASFGFMGPRDGFGGFGAPRKASFDAWAAAEEDLKYRAEQEVRREQHKTVNIAAAIGREGL